MTMTSGIIPPLKFLAALVISCGATTAAFAEQGTVVDRASGAPIPNAIVIATWQGVVGVAVQGTSQCYRVEVKTTDKDGHFDVSAFSWNFNPFMLDRERAVTAWSPGYVLSPEWNPNSLRIPLERRSATPSEMFKNLPSTRAMGCEGAQRVMLPYLKALHREKSRLAATVEERLNAASVLFSIEVIELGLDEAQSRAGVREGEIKQGIRR